MLYRNFLSVVYSVYALDVGGVNPLLLLVLLLLLFLQYLAVVAKAHCSVVVNTQLLLFMFLQLTLPMQNICLH